MFSGSIKKLFSSEYVNIYLLLIFFFNRFSPVEKCGVTPNCLYRDSLTLIANKLYNTNCQWISWNDKNLIVVPVAADVTIVVIADGACARRRKDVFPSRLQDALV